MVNPMGGRGSAGKGWGFDSKIHLLSGRFDRVPLLRGLGHFICLYCYIHESGVYTVFSVQLSFEIKFEKFIVEVSSLEHLL